MSKHGDQVQRALNKMNGLIPSDISGIARYLARQWGQDPFDGVPSNIDALPKTLRYRAYTASKEQLDFIESGPDSNQGWKDIDERVACLKEQVDQFDPNQDQYGGCLLQ